MVVGIFLFLMGFNEEIEEWGAFGPYLFWGAGIVLFVPGCYFTGKLVQAFLAKDPQVRSNILREIPEL